VGLVAPSRLMQVGGLPRVNPGLSFPGHLGPQIGPERQNTGWEPMLNWSSGLPSDIPQIFGPEGRAPKGA
jgi:hypothetical protein